MAQPNVVLIHADQLRYDGLVCMGNPYARTANLDRLAAEGTVFTRHISANTICMPSRASLFTGLYPPGHNVWTNGVALNRREYAVYNGQIIGDGIKPEPPTMADVFAAAGYDTVSFGKLHLTPNLAPTSYGYPETWARWKDTSIDTWHGPYYGFRHVELTEGHGEHPCHGGHYGAWLQREHPDVYRAVVEHAQHKHLPIPALGDLYPSPVPAALHNSTWLANRFRAYLEQRSTDQPFFAFVGFPDPHHPFTPSYDVVQDFEGIDVKAPFDPTGEGARGTPVGELQHDVLGLSLEERRTIIRYTYAMVHQIDNAVGHIIDGLKKAGLWENTIIVFTSDHGDFLCDHGKLRKGYTPSDALLHLPFIMRAPGAGYPGRVDTPMSNVDVLPTLTGLAGVQGPAWVHGQDMTRIVQQDTEHVAMAFCANGQPMVTNYSLYDDAYRCSVYPGRDYVELYDHRADPGECHNLAGRPEHQTHVAAMQQMMQERLMQYHNPILGRVCAW